MRARRVIAALGVAATLLVAGCGSNGEEPSPSPTDALNVLPDGSDSCATANVVASSEKARLLASMADTFNAASKGEDCQRVKVYSRASGEVLNLLSTSWSEADGPKPDVWSPASSTWLRLLTQRATGNDQPDPVPTSAPSIAQTPLVLAMPRPMAEALGWPQTQIGWGDVLRLAQDPAGWGSVGHPEWGQFKLGKTNPSFSTSGLNATVGAFYAATGVSSDLTEAQVADPEVLSYVQGVESSVVHYGDTTLTFLSNLDEAARDGKGLTYVSAVTVEEKSVLDYNAGNPTGDPRLAGKGTAPQVPLVAVYPKEGTLVSDNPYAVLPSASTAAQSAAGAFLDFLTAPAQQERLQQAGFRSSEGVAPKLFEASKGVLPDAPATIAPPAPPVMEKVLSSWRETRKKARVLVLVDVSGSMGEDAGGVSKLDRAKEAIQASFDEFTDADEVGLATFSDEFRVLQAPMSFGEGRSHLEDLVAGMDAGGGTALYASTADAAKVVQSLPASQSIDAVVVLSDGADSEGGDIKALDGALGSSLERSPVRVFTIGYGKGADMDTLGRIAKAGGAAAYDASDATRIETIMTSVFSNF